MTLLTSRSEPAYPGHYLSSVDSERDALTVLKLLYFQEQIFVYVADVDATVERAVAMLLANTVAAARDR